METPAEYITARSDSGSAAAVGELLGVGEGGVPRTLLNQAPTRVMIMALIGSSVYTVHIGMSLYLHPAYMPMPTDRALPIAAWLVFVLVGALVSLVAWRRWVRRELLLDLALCYEVVGAFFIAFAKVLDFGLVKIDTGRETDLSCLTEAGTVSGTPAYMAPEMATSADRVDHRADLYALGCVGYWLLAGRLVFEGRTAMNVIMQHVQESPPRLSRITELQVPCALEELLLQCLAKAPDDRPRTASELRDGLLQIETARDWTPERAKAWWQRHIPELIAETPSQEAAAPVFFVAE